MFRRTTLALVAPLLLAGCFTGPRPSFSNVEAFPAGQSSGDAQIDAVLAKFDHVTAGPVTADYSVLTKYGNLTSTAAIALANGNRAITIENTLYIQNSSGAHTCTVDHTIPCSVGWDATRVSNVGITVDFYAASTAKRLRRDATAKLGPVTTTQTTIAGQTATCVDLPLTGGTARYCTLANGVLAVLDDGAVRIALTKYSATADPKSFTLPT